MMIGNEDNGKQIFRRRRNVPCKSNGQCWSLLMCTNICLLFILFNSDFATCFYKGFNSYANMDDLFHICMPTEINVLNTNVTVPLYGNIFLSFEIDTILAFRLAVSLSGQSLYMMQSH